MCMAAALCLTACKGKEDATTEEGQTEQTEQTQEEQAVTATANSEELEANYSVCPFCLQDKGKVDENGEPVTVERKWICGSSAGASRIADWVLYTQDSRFNFNTDGWHFVGKDIVNADETYKIADQSVYEEMSSFCTIFTEKYTKPAVVEDYVHVAYSRLYSLLDEPPFEVSGIKLLGNQHDYNTPELKEYAGNASLESEHIQSSFYLNEWVTVSLPAELKSKGISIVVMPHQPNYDNVTLDETLLSKAAANVTPELNAESGMLQAEFYVNMDAPVGLYDILIVSNSKPIYRFTTIMSPAKE